MTSFTSVPAGVTGRPRSTSNLALNSAAAESHSPYQSGLSSGQRSPMVSPLGNSMISQGHMQAQLDETIYMQQRMENLQAVMHNEAESQPGIGTAS